jgi:hypothetical protein
MIGFQVYRLNSLVVTESVEKPDSARRGDEGMALLFRRTATQPGGVDRRSIDRGITETLHQSSKQESRVQ